MRFPQTPATRILDAAGIAWSGHSYHHDPRSPSYGREAARELGVDADRVLKTLVVSVSSALGLAIIPVSRSLNLKSAARTLAAVGVPRARTATLADARAAEAATGYVLGGISPLGTRRPLPTMLDLSAITHETVFVSGGRRGFDIELAPDDLIELTGAEVEELAR